MKAAPGHDYAEIRRGAVAVIFTDADLPEWCDASDHPPHEHFITAIDVTGALPNIGDLYDPATGKFTPPPAPPVIVPPVNPDKAALAAKLDVIAGDAAAPPALRDLAPLLKKVIAP